MILIEPKENKSEVKSSKIYYFISFLTLVRVFRIKLLFSLKFFLGWNLSRKYSKVLFNFYDKNFCCQALLEKLVIEKHNKYLIENLMHNRFFCKNLVVNLEWDFERKLWQYILLSVLWNLRLSCHVRFKIPFFT